MAMYFVDYENVHVDGMKSVSKLTEEDSVCIFYSEKANTLTFGLPQTSVGKQSKN